MIMFHLILILSIELITFSQATPPPILRRIDDLTFPVPSKSAPPTPSLHLEVPREEPVQVFYYDYPPPSQELQVPSTQPWNPNNDPTYYFELPSVFNKQSIATNLYPKKYSKDTHEKQKPNSSKPKQEIKLIPISEDDYLTKQRTAHKIELSLVNNQAKVQNKAQQAVQI